MFSFFTAIFSSDQMAAKSDGPEVLVSSAQTSAFAGDEARIVDQENGRVYHAVGESLFQSVSLAPKSTPTASNDDDDPDDKQQQHQQQQQHETGAGRIVITEEFETTNQVGHVDSGSDADEVDVGDGDKDFYHDLSDEEPDSEFLNGCYEYSELSERCYAIRRVNSGRADILAHESTPVVAFCYALQREMHEQMALVTLRSRSATERDFEVARNTPTGAPLGVIGWFVQNVVNDKPVFAFESEASSDAKHVVDLTSTVTPAENPALVASGNSTGIALLENGPDFVERSQLAFAISNGMAREDAIDLLQFTYARQNLRRFDRRGQTAPLKNSIFTTTANDDDDFQPYSPVTATNGRWFVITAAHYTLFKSNELLVQRSGASLARLSQLLDTNAPLFDKTSKNFTDAQERAVLTRFLQSVSVQAERHRHHQRTLLISTLRNKCGQLTAQIDRMRQFKFMPPPLMTQETDADVLSFVTDCIADIDVLLKRFDSDQMNAY
jgi:hypothetical protein